MDLGPAREPEAANLNTLVELRRLLEVLRRTADTPGTGPQPGLAELPALIHTAGAGHPVELHLEGEPVTLPAGLDLSAYRIVQEAVTNAIRYAGKAPAPTCSCALPPRRGRAGDQ